MSNLAYTLKQMRARKALQLGIDIIPIIALGYVLAAGLELPIYWALLLSVALGITAWLILYMQKRIGQINPQHMAQHFNANYSELEHSSQLLLLKPDSLNDLQKLQQTKIQKVFETAVASHQWLPRLNWQRTLIMTFAVAAISAAWPHLVSGFDSADSSSSSTMDTQQAVAIESVNVSVRPPAYTGLSQVTEERMDLSLLAGSDVEWQITFNQKVYTPTLKFADESSLLLQPVGGNTYSASRKIELTGLYQLEYALRETPDTVQTLPDVYALTVRADQKPKITIIEPRDTSFEIAKNQVPEFLLQVEISDDFGLQSTDILASVAKGTGEAVKFRDIRLPFDRQQETENGLQLERDWDLHQLGMEPGDEVYFTVLASDNRQPEANEARSHTVIVRWLDEEKAQVTAEGIVIDFEPEYFKSQRQIIIETEQLIADKPDLSTEVFKQTSYELGQAQSDLKQRYGQYLGDEFGEGPGDQLAEVEVHDDADHDHEHEEEQLAEQARAGHHVHSASESGIEQSHIDADKSGATAVMERFGHHHGEADIGPVTKRNPKALMKRSLGYMWQAELHLMLAEPDKALPFEYEAFKYLKMAQQADRIYVKRLGFEPPPVSEKARLTGELKDIPSLNRNLSQYADNEDDQRLFRQTYELLSQVEANAPLSDVQQTLLRQLSTRLTVLAESRPALIQHAATVQKVLIQGSLNISRCENCLSSLQNKLWSLITHVEASPGNHTGRGQGSEMEQRYQRLLSDSVLVNGGAE